MQKNLIKLLVIIIVIGSNNIEAQKIEKQKNLVLLKEFLEKTQKIKKEQNLELLQLALSKEDRDFEIVKSKLDEYINTGENKKYFMWDYFGPRKIIFLITISKNLPPQEKLIELENILKDFTYQKNIINEEYPYIEYKNIKVK